MWLWAYSAKTARLSIGSSLEGWKYSATTSTGMARGSASAPILVVIASSPPSCRPVSSRPSITFAFLRGPEVAVLHLHERHSLVTLAAYGAGCPVVMRQVSRSPRDILSLEAACVVSAFHDLPIRDGTHLPMG